MGKWAIRFFFIASVLVFSVLLVQGLPRLLGQAENLLPEDQPPARLPQAILREADDGLRGFDPSHGEVLRRIAQREKRGEEPPPPAQLNAGADRDANDRILGNAGYLRSLAHIFPPGDVMG